MQKPNVKKGTQKTGSKKAAFVINQTAPTTARDKGKAAQVGNALPGHLIKLIKTIAVNSEDCIYLLNSICMGCAGWESTGIIKAELAVKDLSDFVESLSLEFHLLLNYLSKFNWSGKGYPEMSEADNDLILDSLTDAFCLFAGSKREEYCDAETLLKYAFGYSTVTKRLTGGHTYNFDAIAELAKETEIIERLIWSLFDAREADRNEYEAKQKEKQVRIDANQYANLTRDIVGDFMIVLARRENLDNDDNSGVYSENTNPNIFYFNCHNKEQATALTRVVHCYLMDFGKLLIDKGISLSDTDKVENNLRWYIIENSIQKRKS